MDHYSQSRARVGRQTVKIMRDWGLEKAIQIYRGGFEAITIALVNSVGREKTCEIFHSVMSMYPPERTKPSIVVDNEKAA